MLCLGCSRQEQKVEPQSAKQGIPKLTLSLQHLDIEAEQIVLLLKVTNQGEYPLTITRLQEGGIGKCSMWKGWHVQIIDQDGRPFGPSCGRGEANMDISKKDLSQFLPNDHFSVQIHIGEWKLTNANYGMENQFYRPVALLQTSGVYDITARLNIFTELLVGSSTPVSWTGEVFSNTVQVEIQYRDSPIPKRLSYPERAVNYEYVCQCRVDCDRTIPKNPCLQFSENQQSQIASAEANRRRDAATLARANAISLLGGTPKKYQPCFCSDRDGPYGADRYPD